MENAMKPNEHLLSTRTPAPGYFLDMYENSGYRYYTIYSAKTRRSILSVTITKEPHAKNTGKE